MTAVQRVRAAYEAIAAAARPEVWITLRGEAAVLADAEAIDARVAAGEDLPLAGRTFAVKDNIDVAGLPTTAACPAYAYTPEAHSPAVARLLGAGAVLLGKTNLDQFATGLVGTRSPHGAVRDARRPEYVSGGSSSGSAVAVALGIADLALGTDTAGSGRVPAAFQGIVGVKPTRGLVPTTGVVPACRSLDCVSIFAPDLALAELVLTIIAGPDPDDPLSRTAPAEAPPAAATADLPLPTPPAIDVGRGRSVSPGGPRAGAGTTGGPRVGAPDPASLSDLTGEARAAFAAARDRLAAAGAEVVEVDIAPLLEAGKLLYGGAFVAERHAAVGAFVESHADEIDPTVRQIVESAASPTASQLFADLERLDAHALATRRLFADLDAILLPTTAAQPTIAAVEADPIGENAKLGAYTNCCNLLDLCAVAVPAGEADGGQFGVTLLAPAFHDAVAAGVASLLLGHSGTPSANPSSLVAHRATNDYGLAAGTATVELFVAGAHLSGMPLNHQLTERGARLVGEARTAPRYRLYALDTEPPKPGVVRVDSEGASLPGEIWTLAPAALGTFLAAIPQPMALGEVKLDDGRTVVGFLCEPIALAAARDITAAGGWRAYLAGG
ncbi:MAG TPA: allophanate hydrolase [Solirubrobacterales bacterium]|nr:allophanate hydrolase [Solirubrobacterales bacterium]